MKTLFFSLLLFFAINSNELKTLQDVEEELTLTDAEALQVEEGDWQDEEVGDFEEGVGDFEDDVGEFEVDEEVGTDLEEDFVVEVWDDEAGVWVVEEDYELPYEEAEIGSEEDEEVDFTRPQELVVGEYFIHLDDICGISRGICDEDGNVPTKCTSIYHKIDGQEICVHRDDSRSKGLELSLDMDTKKVLHGQIWDLDENKMKIFVQSKDDPDVLVVTVKDPLLYDEEENIESKVSTMAHMKEDFPGLIHAAASHSVKLQTDISRRRLNGMNWYSIAVYWTKAAKAAADKHNRDWKALTDEAIAETNVGYSNSGIDLEARVSILEIDEIDYPTTKSCTGAFGRSHMTGVFDYLYDGKCRRDKNGAMRKGRLTRAECEDACMAETGCEGIQMGGYLESDDVGDCETIAFGKKWLQPKEHNPDYKCFHYNRHFGASADVHLLVLKNEVDCAGGAANVNFGLQIGKWLYINTKALIGMFTFGHEVGHAIGLQHNQDAEGADCKGGNRYNCGFVVKCFKKLWSDMGMRTIMAYDSFTTSVKYDGFDHGCGRGGPERKINYYSSPNLRVEDKDGRKYVTGNAKANNVQAIKDKIARFQSSQYTLDACLANPCGSQTCTPREGHQYKCGNGPWKGGDGTLQGGWDLVVDGLHWRSKGWGECDTSCDVGTITSKGWECFDGERKVSDSQCNNSEVLTKPSNGRNCHQIPCRLAGDGARRGRTRRPTQRTTRTPRSTRPPVDPTISTREPQTTTRKPDITSGPINPECPRCVCPSTTTRRPRPTRGSRRITTSTTTRRPRPTRGTRRINTSRPRPTRGPRRITTSRPRPTRRRRRTTSRPRPTRRRRRTTTSPPRRGRPRGPRGIDRSRKPRRFRTEEEVALAAVSDISKADVETVDIPKLNHPYFIHSAFFVAGGIFALFLEHGIRYYTLKTETGYSQLVSDDL